MFNGKFHGSIVLSFLVLFISACNGKYSSADNGFDKICLIYSDVFTDSVHAKKSLDKKHEIVNGLIKFNVFDVDAIQAFTTVASADPKSKYDLFKQSAEYSLKRKWECEFIKNMSNKKKEET